MDHQHFQPFLTQDMFPHMSMSSLPDHHLDSHHPVTIKMEDLQHQQSTARITLSPSAPSEYSRKSSATPSAASTHHNASDQKQQPKKRKSWGQVLPEPKTNLPPRKRAKTEDEKEQRRIERVKRNRLAAHNSRERKRQEVETLQDEKNELEDTVNGLKAQMKKMAQTIAAYQKAAPHVKIDADSVSFDFGGPATPESFTTINPRKASFTSPETSPSLGSIDSPLNTATQPSTPMMEPSLPELDMTQHSAAMLCDLQCQSKLSKWQSLNPNLMATMISLISFNIQLAMTTLLVNPSLTRHRVQTQRILSSWLRRSISSTRQLASRTSSSTFPSLTSLVQSQLACSPNQAQQILLATIQASQPTTRSLTVSRVKGGTKNVRSRHSDQRNLARLHKGLHKKSTKIGFQSWGQQGKPRKPIDRERHGVCLVA